MWCISDSAIKKKWLPTLFSQQSECFKLPLNLWGVIYSSEDISVDALRQVLHAALCSCCTYYTVNSARMQSLWNVLQASRLKLRHRCELLHETLKKLLLGAPLVLFCIHDQSSGSTSSTVYKDTCRKQVGFFHLEFCTATEYGSHCQCKINSISYLFSVFMELLLPCFWILYNFCSWFCDLPSAIGVQLFPDCWSVCKRAGDWPLI